MYLYCFFLRVGKTPLFGLKYRRNRSRWTGNIPLLVTPYLLYISVPPAAAPKTPSVTFLIPGQQFTITRNEPPLNMNETVDAYFVNISGPNDLCGSVNTLHRFSNSTHSYACSGWSPAGQKYTFIVQAANCGRSQRGPESSIVTVCLQSMLGHVCCWYYCHYLHLTAACFMLCIFWIRLLLICSYGHLQWLYNLF